MEFNITFLFTRHGYSCANVLHSLSQPGNIFPDAALADYGIREANDLGKHLNEYMNLNNIKPNIVLCSPLTRAIETALIAYNKTKIYVCPYITEKRDSNMNDKDNEPLTLIDLHKKYDSNNYIDFTLIDLYHHAYYNSSYDKFIRFCLPTILKINNFNRNITIAIVSHRNFILDHFNRIKTNNIIINNTFDNFKNCETWSENCTIIFDNINITIKTNELKKIYDGFPYPDIDIDKIQRCLRNVNQSNNIKNNKKRFRFIRDD